MPVNPATSSSFDIVSSHQFAEIRKDTSSGQQSLFSLQTFNEEDVITSFGAALVSATPSYLTVQINEKKHINLYPFFLQYINHGCNPNCFFDTTQLKVIALKNIAIDEEFTFFYPSTEWKMESPFTCYCNQPNCLTSIRGAAHISEEILSKYKLSDFIRKKLQKRLVKKKSV